MSAPLHLLAAGAAKGIVGALQRDIDVRVEATFDAAGAIRDAIVAGVACDVVILPAAMLDTLAAEGRIDAESIAALGRVPTGIAVASGEASPAIGNADDLREALLGASALYCPDTTRATAGIHFTGVLRTLGIHAQSVPKLRAYANGARAMAALAAERPPGAIGCTQASEILYTPGVVLVGALPAPFELATLYAVAVSSNADTLSAARRFAAHLASSETLAVRRAGGFLERSTEASAIR